MKILLKKSFIRIIYINKNIKVYIISFDKNVTIPYTFNAIYNIMLGS